MAPTRTIESTKSMAVMLNRIDKARRFVAAIKASLPNIDREELLWGASVLTDTDWQRMADQLGEYNPPSPVTRGIIFGLLAGDE